MIHNIINTKTVKTFLNKEIILFHRTEKRQYTPFILPNVSSKYFIKTDMKEGYSNNEIASFLFATNALILFYSCIRGHWNSLADDYVKKSMSSA